MTIWNEQDPKKIEKKRITRTANAIGFAFLIGYIGTTALQFFLTKVVPSEILSADGFMWLLQIVLSTLIFTIPFIIMTSGMNTRVSVACSFKKVESGLFLPIVLCGMGVCMVANVLGSVTTSIFYSLGFTDANSSLNSDASGGLILPIIAILAGAFLPGLIEEFALRGIVLGSLKKFGFGFAIISSSVMFGLMHATFSQMPFAFIIGLYLGFSVIRTGSMWPAVIIHILNNLFAFLTESLASVVSDKSISIINIIYFLLMATLGFLGIYIGRKKDIFSLTEEETDSKLTLSEKLKAFFSSVGIILTIIYVAFEILLVQIMRVLNI